MPVSNRVGERGIRAALFVLGLGAVAPLPAAEFAYGLGYSATRSDNITRVPVGERSETIHSYLAGLTYLERSTDVLASVLAQAEWRNYQDGVYDDESVFNLKSSLLWTLSPQRFTWTVEDAYERTRIDTTLPDTPNNRTNVNVFSTGPDFYVRFNPVHTLALGARAGNVYTGRADADNDRFSAAARWLYQATSVSMYSLNLQSQRVTYDDPVLNTDFARHDVFFRADYRPSRSQYVLDAGVSRINPDRGRDLEGTLARLSWMRQLSPESRFGLSFSGEYSDTGTDILAASSAAASSTGTPVSTGVPGGLTSDAVTGDVYYAKRSYVFYNRQGSRYALDFSANTQELDFETAPQDRKETAGSLRLDLYYSGATSLRLFAEQTRTEYLNFVRRDTNREFGARVSYRVSRGISLALEGRRADLVSSEPGVEFEENRVLLSLLYSSSPLFMSAATR